LVEPGLPSILLPQGGAIVCSIRADADGRVEHTSSSRAISCFLCSSDGLVRRRDPRVVRFTKATKVGVRKACAHSLYIRPPELDSGCRSLSLSSGFPQQPVSMAGCPDPEAAGTRGLMPKDGVQVATDFADDVDCSVCTLKSRTSNARTET
jgi:hypothetical protein